MASRVLATIISMRDQFTAPARKIAGSTRAINREVQKTQNQMNKFGKDIVKVGAIGATALAGITVASVKLGMEYSESVAKISTIADTHVVSMDNMSKSILKLSNDTGASANALANDVYDAISSGVSTADAVKTVATTTKLAKAGFAETGQSLDLMTTIVNAYGKSMKEADYISDVLIQTQNQGKVTVAELAESMGKVIPTANASNVGIEQVASGYAIMTSNGIKAAEATTYMNSMMNELMKSGTKASNTIENSTGKSFQELMKSGKSLSDVLIIMQKEAKKDGKSLADMFGSAEAGKAALVLSKNEGKSFNDVLEKMKNSTGETQKAFDKMNAEPIVKLRKATEQMKNKGIELGLALLPTVNKIMEGLLKLTEIPISPYITDIFKIAKSTYEFISKNWSTIAPIIITISTAFAVYKGIMIAMAIYTKAYAMAEFIKNAILATGATRITVMTIAQWALNAAMTANPVGLVIAGIAALIAIGIVLYKNWDTVKAYCIGLWETIKGFFTTLMQNPFISVAVNILALLNPIGQVIQAVRVAIGIFDKLFGKKKGTNAKITVEEGTEKSTTGMKKFALGGIANRPSIFGEAGAEIAIPLNNSKRSKNLLSQANNLIGGNSNVTNNKQIQVIIQGDIYGFNDFKEKVAKAMYEVIHIDGSNVAVAK